MGIRNEARVIKSWKRSTLEDGEMNGKGDMERKKRKKEVGFDALSSKGR